ncbi:hypothetical protein M3689_02510 [Alkalihalophilus marmarensis]|jgi:hypothetical protein|uniref:Uncharacterized protein n=1 Tax=Alkalihalophilus marmarensis DSM 21297 TaxID=1188261 RepID=U6STM8_9BACI|nr:hypothetical protein [Alkalihalophilus marmarensis]ERN54006.1 hypothetical protein A33I_08525 [Alkalihalophilus marmarensis DSM 21297]MCM3488175.1 hypothetical protein [Alkalihalophilus marmarensis]
MGTDNNSRYKKVTIDFYLMQLKWVAWFIPCVLAAYLLLGRFIRDSVDLDLVFHAFMYQPSKVFMLICGIMACFVFFNFYVRNGVTRKDVFLGTSIAAALLAVSIMIISVLLSAILMLIGSFTPFSPGMGQLEFLGAEQNLLTFTLSTSLIIFSYYIGGWVISVGFYRYGWLIGMAFIAIGVVLFALTDSFWEAEIAHSIADSINITFPQLSFITSIVGTIVVIAASLYLVRQLTKSVRIKLQ